MKPLSYLILILFIGCAGNKTIKTDIQESKSIPEWVTDQEKVCSKDFICATGEGESFLYADVNARKSLASIFESRIQANTSESLESFNDDVTQTLSSEASVSVSEDIDQILEGVEITKRAHYKKLYFSMAVLPKKKIKSLLTERLDTIQDNLKNLLNQKKRSNFFKIHTLIKEESKLIQKLILVDEYQKYKDSFKLWKKQDATLPRLNLCIANIGSFKNLEAFMTALINSVGHKVVPGDDSCNYMVKIVANAKKEFMNVKGFQKMSIQTFVEFLSKKGETIGSIEIKEMETGRSFSAIESKVLGSVREKLIEDFDKLNMP